MPLINCEINLLLSWAKNCVVTNLTDAGTFVITDTKLYIPVVTLSTQDKIKLLEQSELRFTRTINWNKYQSKVSTQAQN